MTITLNIDKSNWKKYRFDEFAQNVSERVEPAQTDLDLYVGLEHIDPDCLHLSRHGHPSDVEGTKLRFYAGDVIFGRRRAYQRKTALATQDGICSAHAMVLRAKENIVDSRFFPFLFHSKQFIDMSITISVGGLSPTINWKDIAKQEFLLPPLAEQRRLAELLWAADEMIEKEKRELEGVESFRLSMMKECFHGKSNQVRLKELPIEEINGLWKSDEQTGIINVNVIRSTEFSDYGTICFDKLEPMPVKVSQYKSRKLLPNDIIVERSGGGPDQPVGRVCLFEKADGEYSFSNFTSCIRVKDSKVIIPKYLFYFLRYYWEMKGTDRIQNQTTGIRNLDYELYKMIKVPILSLEEQESTIAKVNLVQDDIFALKQQIIKSQEVKQEIINKIF